jgi:hypothetical protein
MSSIKITSKEVRVAHTFGGRRRLVPAWSDERGVALRPVRSKRRRRRSEPGVGYKAVIRVTRRMDDLSGSASVLLRMGQVFKPGYANDEYTSAARGVGKSLWGLRGEMRDAMFHMREEYGDSPAGVHVNTSREAMASQSRATQIVNDVLTIAGIDPTGFYASLGDAPVEQAPEPVADDDGAGKPASMAEIGDRLPWGLDEEWAAASELAVTGADLAVAVVILSGGGDLADLKVTSFGPEGVIDAAGKPGRRRVDKIKNRLSHYGVAEYDAGSREWVLTSDGKDLAASISGNVKAVVGDSVPL